MHVKCWRKLPDDCTAVILAQMSSPKTQNVKAHELKGFETASSEPAAYRALLCPSCLGSI